MVKIPKKEIAEQRAMVKIRSLLAIKTVKVLMKKKIKQQPLKIMKLIQTPRLNELYLNALRVA
jgi:hypothetical protein